MKISRQQLEQQVERLSAENYALSIAMMNVVEGKEAAAREKWMDQCGKDYGQYEAHLYEPWRGDGGVVVRVFKHEGQRAMVEGHFAEQWFGRRHTMTADPCNLNERVAMERLEKKARKLAEAKRE